MLRQIFRQTVRQIVIQPREETWSGRTISSCSPSRHHYWSLPDSRSSSLRRMACLELSATRETTRLFPAQLSSRISLSTSRRKRSAVIRTKESARAPALLIPRTYRFSIDDAPPHEETAVLPRENRILTFRSYSAFLRTLSPLPFINEHFTN